MPPSSTRRASTVERTEPKFHAVIKLARAVISVVCASDGEHRSGTPHLKGLTTPPVHTNLPCRFRAHPPFPLPQPPPVDLRCVTHTSRLCVILCARAQASFDSVVISGSTVLHRHCAKMRGKGGRGREWTMQEIDNHRTFNYFLNAAPELSHHGQELAGHGICGRYLAAE